MRICSLFSGIGGLELGLEAAGVGETLWQVEQDAFCRSVLAKHWPEARRFEDVRAVRVGDIAGAELICGGFPCQDISRGNPKGVGLAGARSSLWWEFARLIRAVLPRFVVIENVPILASRGRGLDVILREIAQSGYDAEWDIVSARAVGACHRRDRLFIIAWLRDFADSDSEPIRQLAERKEGGRVNIQAGGKAGASEDGAARITGRPWQALGSVCPVDDGIPGRVAMLRALGNAVVPQVAYQVGLRVKQIAEASTV